VKVILLTRCGCRQTVEIAREHIWSDILKPLNTLMGQSLRQDEKEPRKPEFRTFRFFGFRNWLGVPYFEEVDQ
jgi:hypothetical protein